MDSMSYILFICIASPVVLMLLPIERKSRKVVLFLLIGMFSCLFVSEVNGLLLRITQGDTVYFTTNITPITEEIVKMLPVLYYAVVFSDNPKSVITVSFTMGVGFAVLENLIILTQHFESVNLWFALIRGFSSGLMHSICTVIVGYFITFVRKKRKLFFSGTLCALNLAIVYHSVFNLLVEADSSAAKTVGYFLPFVTYAVLNIFFLQGKKKKQRKAD